MEYREKILSLARLAPVSPTQVAKALDTNTMMSGAMLSELVSKGLLKATHIKVGSSPLYYSPKNEAHLARLSKHLGDKDRRTVALLEERRILRDSEQPPLVQVGLRQVKDFAIPLEVAYADKKELFWKWFLLPDSEAQDLVRKIISPVTKKEEKIVKTAPVSPVKLKQEPIKPESTSLKPAPKSVKQEKPKVVSDFWTSVERFFSKSNISLQEKSVVRKGKEFDLIIGMSSTLGPLTFFCKVKNKKRVSDTDLSAAYVEGQVRKLPVVFLTTGELTQKAKLLLPKLKGFTFKKVGDGS